LARAEQQDSGNAADSQPRSAPDAEQQAAAAYDRAFPKTGLFSIADPKQEVWDNSTMQTVCAHLHVYMNTYQSQ